MYEFESEVIDFRCVEINTLADSDLDLYVETEGEDDEYLC